jgi:rhodanese-related sulfurtransferase/glutaredoxin
MKQKIILLLIAAISLVAVTAQSPVSSTTIGIDSFLAKIKREIKPQLIDARSPEEFAKNHLYNAININSQTANYQEQIDALDKTKTVFIYSIQNGRSSLLAKELLAKGFKEVYDLLAGIGSWVGSGNPYYTSASKGLSTDEYKKILAENKTVLVDIGSQYCGSCKRVKPILDSLRKEQGTALKIVELELEDSPQLISSLKTVTAFPYLILYREGNIVLQRSGLKDLKNDIDAGLAKNK